MRGKLLFISLLTVSVLFSTNIIGQRIQGALMGGFNLTQVDGDEIYGFNKLGFNTGVAALVPFGKSFYFSIETIYNQKGSYQSPQYSEKDTADNELTGEYRVKLDYLEVPVLLMYNDKDIVTVGAGFSFGRLISIKEYEHGRLIETSTLNSGPYEMNDFNILADLRFKLHKKLKLNFRYSYSLAKIRTRAFFDTRGNYLNTRKQFNNVLSFRLIYMFNEKPPLADDKNKDAGF